MSTPRDTRASPADHAFTLASTVVAATEALAALDLKPYRVAVTNSGFGVNLEIQFVGADTISVATIGEKWGLALDYEAATIYGRQGVTELAGRQVHVGVYTGQPESVRRAS